MSDAERFAARSPASSDGAVDADGDGAPLDFTERLSLAEMRSKFTLEDRFVQLDGMVDKAQRDLSRGYFVPPSQLQTQAERLQEALNTFAMRVTRESPKEAFERAEAVIVGEKGAESDVRCPGRHAPAGRPHLTPLPPAPDEGGDRGAGSGHGGDAAGAGGGRQPCVAASPFFRRADS